ncbi:elongation factor Ts [Candidatus Dojkabacteria bacterium]|uniref:Elongation factor Ts n=1 Tax=Candidatus Dojkabacteria bacterium TaxID=2099670 RepID=A0A955L9D1_9BACT|nr:elongation factor Ts [Candidatus Dojkabacteria bacterium]
MATITLEQIKDLRKRTGVGINHVKEALEESEGDIEKAILYLRKKGIAKAAKRSENSTNYGYIASYIHGDGQIGVIVEVNTETDFAARNEKVREIAYDLALHVAASDPQYTSVEDIPEEVITREKEVFEKDLEGKPEGVAAKILEGKLQKFYEEVVLEEQVFLKDETKKVKDLINDTVAAIGEKIIIGRFARIQIAGGASACVGE